MIKPNKTPFVDSNYVTLNCNLINNKGNAQGRNARIKNMRNINQRLETNNETKSYASHFIRNNNGKEAIRKMEE